MSNSKTIPVRMPDELYQEVIASKPAEVRVSTYLLMLVRKGLNSGVESFSTKLENSRDSVNNSREIVDDVLISSLQFRIAGLEQQLGGVQSIVDDAHSIRSEATKALLSIDATVDAAVKKAVDNCELIVHIRIQEGIQQQMEEVLGESPA